MAIGQFTEITLNNRSSTKPLTIKNVTMKWGKIYPEGKRNGDEINPDTVNGTVVKKDKPYVFRTCGRSDAASGTEGTFDLFDGEELVRSVYWSSPWGTSDNVFNASGENRDWMAEANPAGNQGSGAGPLGPITLTLVYIG